MKVKIATLEQTRHLKVGDQIGKFPIQGSPEQSFPEAGTPLMEIYDIRTLNAEYSIIGLVIASGSRINFASPADVTRIFISQANLIAEDLWWV